MQYLPGTTLRKRSENRSANWLKRGAFPPLFAAVGIFVAIAATTFQPQAVAAACYEGLTGADVLILVNANSPCSRSIADLYRRYHPDVTDAQVLTLGPVPAYPNGLPDCAATTSTSADEIITRDQFENLVAQPVRSHLISSGRVNSTFVIITTAGMPYRIKDTNPSYANVVCPAGTGAYPGGSDPNTTVTYRHLIDAASIESELSVLFQIDPALPTTAQRNYTTTGRMPTQNRVVNPYQAYSSPIKSWSALRDVLGRRSTLNWTVMRWVSLSPKIEGTYYTGGFTSLNRRMSPADLYLVARLDGPRGYGEYPIFSVKKMLDRAAAASDPCSPSFVGFNRYVTDIIVDDSAQCCSLQCSAVYNVRPKAVSATDPFVSFGTHPLPPGGEDGQNIASVSGCHHEQALQWLTGYSWGDQVAGVPITNGLAADGQFVWDGTNLAMNSTIVNGFLGPDRGIIALLTYGVNGNDGRRADYLYTSGPMGGAAFSCAPGAVFSSLESYNATSMFTTPATRQGKIVDYIEIGGTAAIGHAFEPEGSALIQGDYLLKNILRDDDGDGVADLTLVEAAYTATPYVSWTPVLIGDPLLRLRLGPGGLVSTTETTGDVDGDGLVNATDLAAVMAAYGSAIGNNAYDPAADVDRDGAVGATDLSIVQSHLSGGQ